MKNSFRAKQAKNKFLRCYPSDQLFETFKKKKFQAPGPVQIQGPTQVLILNRNLKSKNVQRHYNQNTGCPTPLFNFYKNATVDKGCGRVVEVIKINCLRGNLKKQAYKAYKSRLNTIA